MLPFGTELSGLSRATGLHSSVLVERRLQNLCFSQPTDTSADVVKVVSDVLQIVEKWEIYLFNHIESLPKPFPEHPPLVFRYSIDIASNNIIEIIWPTMAQVTPHSQAPHRSLLAICEGRKHRAKALQRAEDDVVVPEHELGVPAFFVDLSTSKKKVRDHVLEHGLKVPLTCFAASACTLFTVATMVVLTETSFDRIGLEKGEAEDLEPDLKRHREQVWHFGV